MVNIFTSLRMPDNFSIHIRVFVRKHLGAFSKSSPIAPLEINWLDEFREALYQQSFLLEILMYRIILSCKKCILRTIVRIVQNVHEK